MIPYNLIAYVLAALTLFGSGYFMGYQHEHNEVVKLQVSIDYANQLSAQKLKEATEKVAQQTELQQTTITTLQAKHDAATNQTQALTSALVDAQRMYRRDNQTRSDCPLPKVSDTQSGKDNGGTGQIVQTAELSARIDRLISDKAASCDKIDADKHFLLQWLDSIPSDLTQ